MPSCLCRLGLLAAMLAPLGGCIPADLFAFPPQAHGAQVDADQLSQLVPGISTRKDVEALIGTATSKAPFDDNNWIYVSQITQPVIAATQGVLSQHVYALTFDSAGVLTQVVMKDKADALRVHVVSRITPSPGSESSFMQQLIGNIGRFNPTGQALPSGPSSTNSPGNGGGGL